MRTSDGSSNKVLVMGGLIIDQYLLVDQYPGRGEDVLISDSFKRVGGSTINVACTLKNLGVDAYPVSTIGNDKYGSMIENYLLEANIKKNCVRVDKGEATGYCLVIVDSSSERTFMTYKGCEGKFSPALIDDKLLTEIAFVYITGYYLQGQDAAAVISFIKNIKESGASIMFDPGPLVDEIEPTILCSILTLSDVFIPNVKELKKIKDKLAITEEFNEWAIKYNINYLIIKNGNAGVIAYQANQRYQLPAFKVAAIDTTGAGDSFAAGCIYGFLNHLALEEILKLGCACGALSTTVVGPNASFDIEDIKAVIKGEENYVR
jgi:sugar/nucleoside kinase (ribokinase family)